MRTPPLSATPGLLGGRYRLVGELARGGMASVLRARDEVLQRDVAVKILHPHLANDPAFLDRFRREARAAASLSHPNLVAVYDWGEDDGQAFLVMELVDGPSLRAILQARGRLTPTETVAILGPAAHGLAAAHAHGLVHRDVKPENVLVDGAGVVKVTDFGLVRAAAASTQTFANAIVGSPHYLSPEAVRGEPVDATADVYSLGVVAFECLTGRRPFEGDNAMAVALRHTTEAVPPPSRFAPDVPTSFDDLVARATSAHPALRHRDASVFAEQIARAAPAGSTEPVRVGRVGTDTVVLPAFTTDTVVAGPAGPPPAPTSRGRPPTPPRGRQPAPPLRRRRVLLPLALVLLLVSGAVLAWATLISPLTAIPPVAGLPQEQAISQLMDAGFEVQVDRSEHSGTMPAGYVLSHDPAGSARRGALVSLVTSLGPRQVQVPAVVGLGEAQAQSAVERAGLRPVINRVYDPVVAEGVVVSTDPVADAVIDEADAVTLNVSRGREPVSVPNVVGVAIENAEATLRDGGLEPIRAGGVYSDTVPAGAVVAQDPPGDSGGFRGDQITLTPSLGPELVTVPDVRGYGVGDATAILEDARLTVDVERIRCFLRPSDQVVEQDPAGGNQVRVGTEVVLFACE